MAFRKIIEIDEAKCDGCGLCISACAEGALKLVDGKARVVSDTFCDGLGACLGECPQGALKIIERDAPEFDETAVEVHLAGRPGPQPLSVPQAPTPGGCPGTAVRQFTPPIAPGARPFQTGDVPTKLGQWPVQLMLVPPHAPFLREVDLLVCADCVPFAVADFHQRYLDGRVVVVACPKLDDLQHYLEKLTQMFAIARPSRITVLKMEVPCCGGIAQAAVAARNQATPDIPLEVHTVSIQGGPAAVQNVPVARTGDASMEKLA